MGLDFVFGKFFEVTPERTIVGAKILESFDESLRIGFVNGASFCQTNNIELTWYRYNAL